MAKRRKHRRLSEGLSKRGKKSRKGRRRRGMSEGLSSAFSPASLTGSGKAMLSGAIGGVLAEMIAGKLLSKATPLQRILTLAGSSFLFGAVLKMPNVGAGIGGAIGRELFSKPSGMAENVDYITNFPKYLQEGNENAQLSAGNYFSENTQLSEEDYLAQLGIAKAYGM